MGRNTRARLLLPSFAPYARSSTPLYLQVAEAGIPYPTKAIHWFGGEGGISCIRYPTPSDNIRSVLVTTPVVQSKHPSEHGTASSPALNEIPHTTFTAEVLTNEAKVELSQKYPSLAVKVVSPPRTQAV